MLLITSLLPGCIIMTDLARHCELTCANPNVEYSIWGDQAGQWRGMQHM